RLSFGVGSGHVRASVSRIYGNVDVAAPTCSPSPRDHCCQRAPRGAALGRWQVSTRATIALGGAGVMMHWPRRRSRATRPPVAGIIRYGTYVPYFRLTRAAIGAGKGERAVASYDEDAVSLAVEAARDAVRGGIEPDTLLFATLSPPYAEKLNAATTPAALDRPAGMAAADLGGSSRAGLGAVLLGLDLATAGQRVLVCASDVVVGAPGGARETQGGDAGVAFVTGADGEALAQLVGRAST